MDVVVVCSTVLSVQITHQLLGPRGMSLTLSMARGQKIVALATKITGLDALASTPVIHL